MWWWRGLGGIRPQENFRSDYPSRDKFSQKHNLISMDKFRPKHPETLQCYIGIPLRQLGRLIIDFSLRSVPRITENMQHNLNKLSNAPVIWLVRYG